MELPIQVAVEQEAIKRLVLLVLLAQAVLVLS
jgi:hypothetical protein